MRYQFGVVSYLVSVLVGPAGCSSESSVVDDPPDNRDRPPPPPPQKPGTGPGLALAIDKIFLGDTDRDDVPNQAAGWMQYGFNLDGKVSDVTSTDLCQPVGQATPRTIYRDGHNGIDNAFGNIVVDLIRVFSQRPSEDVSRAMFNGESTLIMKIEGLGKERSYNPLTAELYAGAALAAPPRWDGNDIWHVLPGKPDVSAKMADGYLVDDMWVSGADGLVDLKLKIAGEYVNVTIRHAIIAAQLDEEHLSVTEGTIAGIIETDVLVKEARDFAVRLNDGFCSGDTVPAMLEQIRASSDIMKEGPQDPTQPCNGISIGVGFTAKRVQLGEEAPAAEPPPDPCL